MSKELNDLRMSVMVEMGGCMNNLWEQRINAPEGTDLLSRMIHSDAMREMVPGEFISNMALLIVGGNDTTRNTMSGIVEALDRFPGRARQAGAEPRPDPQRSAGMHSLRHAGCAHAAHGDGRLRA